MIKERRRRQTRRMLFSWTVVVVVLELALALALVVEAASPRQRERQLAQSNFYKTCEQLCTGGSSLDERANCVSKCVSPSCFEKIYASNPLEDGEIDEFRKNRFLSCMNSERRTSQDDKRWKGEENVSDLERRMRDSEWTAKS